ncbi:hypothetical protein M407DRAFT_19044 [Tulasnella calospora MUT 4182]|uniref:Uncharacterized protein n=1 Tax=Tulasnella calospora MUT 4182 TaxID=1051891 RepID=A0A0C3LDK4_9AGAM|nr:hypothetical protein M407DRAFT_19044 [Tulasnella calospora MUT 4182]
MLPHSTAGAGQDLAPSDSSLKDISDPPQRRARGSWAATELSEDDEDERFALPGSYPVLRPEEPFEEPVRRTLVDDHRIQHHGNMETPAAAPQARDTDTSDIIPQSSGSLIWITFGGSPGESSTVFVQSVQRLAFEQGRADDDRWIAHYVSTCFEGDALIWYSDLEEEIQGSWRNVRAALLRRYPPTSGGGPLGSSQLARSPPSTAVAALKSSGQVGLIGLSKNDGAPQGYISVAIDGSAVRGATVTLDKDEASQVIVPRAETADILHLYRAAASTDDKFPYLGLALFDHIAVPEPLKGMYQVPGIRDKMYDRNAPFPSRKCNGREPYAYDGDGPIATWVLEASGESRSAAPYRRRSDVKDGGPAVAAVWKYNEKTEELTVTWPMDDGTECELGAYLPSENRYDRRPNMSPGLHFHRIVDMTPANIGDYVVDDRVHFAFHPEP